MTGIELIAKERQEQIEKHGYSQEHDKSINCNGELAKAAMATLNFFVDFPKGWDEKACERIKNKDYKERLIIAGAFITAELDRLLDETPLY